jgi:hypothetical protein
MPVLKPTGEILQVMAFILGALFGARAWPNSISKANVFCAAAVILIDYIVRGNMINGACQTLVLIFDVIRIMIMTSKPARIESISTDIAIING